VKKLQYLSPRKFRNFVGAALLPAIFLIGGCQTAAFPIMIAIHCGGQEYQDSRGIFWKADRYFHEGEIFKSSNSIAGTTDYQLFQTQRYGNFGYSIPINSGKYLITLYFAETYFTSVGSRKFRVTAEGNTLLNEFDVLSEAGAANHALVKRFLVTVKDNYLDLTFIGQKQNASISGIEIATENQPTLVKDFPPQLKSILQSGAIGAPANSFSKQLTRYPIHSSAKKLTVEQILKNTETLGVKLGFRERNRRRDIVAMYKNFGIDISLDPTSQASPKLLNLRPKNWSTTTPQPLSGSFLQPYSIDASFYHQIPSNYPRVPLPIGYFPNFQFNTVQGGDGIGFGIAISSSSDPTRRIRSEWYGNPATLKDYYMPVRAYALSFQGYNKNGDAHLTFIDSSSRTMLNGYKVSLDPDGVDYLSLYAAGIYPLGTLGDIGGSVAAGFSNIGPLLRTGEATNSSTPIPHAVGGAVSRPWKARVYPAYSWDVGIDGTNPCDGTSPMNTGSIPYGGIVQLDPSLVFTAIGGNKYQTTVNGQSFTVSLPTYRILEAMQHYGYYIMDTGCTGLDIYTSTNQQEFDPYGGIYGNANGPGIQNEIQSVLLKANLFVVPPVVKR
jgi:hypothetical protein